MTTITNNKLTDERVSNATLIRLIQWAEQHNSHYVAAALCELQERRKADSAEPAGYHVIKECGKVGCSVATLEEAEKTRDFWNKKWTIRPYFYSVVPAPVVPETLPCSVELKPGLIIGKGCKTEILLTALKRRADYYAELEAMTPEERAERDAGIEAFKAMLPTPADSQGRPRAPVVPEDISGIIERFQYQADHLSDWHHIDEHSCKVNRRDLMTALEFMDSCRAAMLQMSGNSEQLNQAPVKQPSSDDVIGWLRSDYNSDDKRDPDAPLFMLGSNNPSETWGVKYMPLTGNSPVTPDGYALVPVEPTDEMIAAAMNCEDVLFNSDESFCVQFGNIYEAMLLAAPQQGTTNL
ncbi:hypothetical protein AHN20_16850 [Salmonella enterica subsp. enterica]|nr:hypothetical protein [Salmonella enterica subsp. enterica]